MSSFTRIGGGDLGYTAENVANKGQPNGYPTLGADSKVPSGQLPNSALTSINEVANETAQLALDVQAGDLCVRTDENKTYVALNSDNTDMDDWLWLPAGNYTPELTQYNVQTENYQLLASDKNKVVIMNNAADRTITFPQDSVEDISIGSVGRIWNIGAGELSLAKGTGANLTNAFGNINCKIGGAPPFQVQWEKASADSFYLYGNVKPF